MRQRVLILSPHVFPKPHSGLGMRGHFGAVHLSAEFDVTVVSETGIYEVRNGEFSHVRKTAVKELGSAHAYLKSFVAGTLYAYEKFNCRQWAVPSFDDYGHIIVHYAALLPFLAGKKTSSTVIFDTHNNEREYFESIAEQARSPLKRRAMRGQADISERLIRSFRDAVHATVSVSESDRDWVASLCSDSTTHFVVPNNLFRYSPARWSGRKTVLYIGTLNVSMNLQALDWFRRNVWPEVRRRVPEVEFVVAGRSPSASLVADLEQDGIRVVVSPESLDPVYADAMFSAIPATSGSGAKIKVCEALSRGVPVLTTPTGLVGQPEAIKRSCVVRDSPEEWVAAIEEQARRAVRSTPEWDAAVSDALSASYFGNSIQQIAALIRSEVKTA